MIKRYTIRCLTCDQNHTLRITLGTEATQHHTFTCPKCGEYIRVALDLDFINRESYEVGLEEPLSYPTAHFKAVDNCTLSDQEGLITNLDPTFLVPDKLLHEDKVFPWMYSAHPIVSEKGILDKHDIDELKRPIVLDVIDSLGIPRFLATVMEAFCKGWRLYRRGQSELLSQQLDLINNYTAIQISDVFDAAILVSSGFIGKQSEPVVRQIIEEVRDIRNLNISKYNDFCVFALSRDFFNDAIDRQVDVMNEYLRGFDQFNQTLIYASHGKTPEISFTASSHDLSRVRLFYGEAFEQLATALLWPACLNNLKSGRSFDAFKTMTLKEYQSINKARRHEPFTDNKVLSTLADEFDSTIRNASHHGNIRLSKESKHVIEYRSGDTNNWKRMSYSEYLLKSNRIQISLMRLLILQIFIFQDHNQ
ncbi:MAG TPA: hypothetical protein VND01_00730 [Candidatus Acidoferrales bacterium]|nr:hypothetical protein [Candidatus Acidoferrales bacterium]